MKLRFRPDFRSLIAGLYKGHHWRSASRKLNPSANSGFVLAYFWLPRLSFHVLDCAHLLVRCFPVPVARRNWTQHLLFRTLILTLFAACGARVAGGPIARGDEGLGPETGSEDKLTPHLECWYQAWASFHPSKDCCLLDHSLVLRATTRNGVRAIVGMDPACTFSLQLGRMCAFTRREAGSVGRCAVMGGRRQWREINVGSEIEIVHFYTECDSPLQRCGDAAAPACSQSDTRLPAKLPEAISLSIGYVDNPAPGSDEAISSAVWEEKTVICREVPHD